MEHVVRQIRRMAARQATGTQTDEELLERFLTGEDEAAFTALVRRHGPMVLGVCLALLHHRQDAEDAFQATFLMLVRKEHSIQHRGALASWLYRVAFRVALRLKAKSDKHPADVLAEVPVDADPCNDASWRELRPILDTEVNRLPAKYRAPMVLCYLEGKTYEEAAFELGCPKGTVAIRLLRGKLLLKNRLVRRGLVLSAGLVAAGTVLPQAQAAVSFTLQSTTAAAGMAMALGAGVRTVAPAVVAGLVEATMREFGLQRLHAAVAILFGLVLTGVGIGPYLATRDAPTGTPTTMVADADNSSPVALSVTGMAAKPVPPLGAVKPDAEPLAAADPAEPAPCANSSIVVILDSSRSPHFERDDFDFEMRQTYRTNRAKMTHIVIHQGGEPCRRSMPGLAVRERLDGEPAIAPPQPPACPPPPALTRASPGQRVAVTSYRFILENGDEVKVIFINRT